MVTCPIGLVAFLGGMGPTGLFYSAWYIGNVNLWFAVVTFVYRLKDYVPYDAWSLACCKVGKWSYMIISNYHDNLHEHLWNVVFEFERDNWKNK
jgi:hypothetical protein